MTLPSFVIIVVIAVIAAVIFLQLAAIPGAKARERGHPQAEAINILGWLGLLLGFAPWIGALVWAYTRPGLLPAPEASPRVEPPPTEESQISSE
jgi:hypothetical protein